MLAWRVSNTMDAKFGLDAPNEAWTRFGHYYNARRTHSTLAARTPDEAYGATEMGRLAA